MRKLSAVSIIGIIVMSLVMTFPQSLAQSLAVTVTTDKSSYTYREKVTVKGNLTLDGTPVDGFVGIEVNSLNPTFSNFTHFVTRTATIGNPYLGNYNITIVSLATTDTLTPPKLKTTFKKGETIGVNVTVQNSFTFNQLVVVTIMICDNDSSPITSQVEYAFVTLGGRGNATIHKTLTIQTWVSTGNAKVYANVYSGWPSLRGHPWCSEKSAGIIINPATSGSSETSQQSSSSNLQTADSQNAYTLSFRLPPFAPQGNYAVNSTAFAQGFIANSTTTFNRPYQIVGDINFDRLINIIDLVAVTAIYGAKSGDSNWNPVVDVQPSGKIDITDVVTVTGKYGTHY